MLSLPPAVRIFVCTAPTDMRKSFDSLAALAQTVVGEDPLSGHLFLFRNRQRDRVKLLWWDRDGLAIWYKRLEAGVFDLPSDRRVQRARGTETEGEPPARLEIRADELAMLLGGIDLASVKRRPRYERPKLTETVRQAS
jgi:transposase